MAERPYDLVLFGATGFTGGMTAEYLARHAPSSLRLALAGRNQQKLEAVKKRLVDINPQCASVGILEADIGDDESLQSMAASTRVLLTTVGPFIDYGEPVARACIEQGTDYIDSTGEPQYVDLLLNKYQARAVEQGVRLIPSCGFDSVPADLGVLFTVLKLPEAQSINVSGYLSLRAMPSGGTERSAIKTFAPRSSDNPEVPPVASEGRVVRLNKARVEKKHGGWSAPLETLDGVVVTRSAAARSEYGQRFSYAHHVIHPNFLVMGLALFFFGTLAFLARLSPLREAFLSLAKKSGQGPNKKQMDRGWFRMRFEAEADGTHLETEVSGGEPFYTETSKILAEAALCLLEYNSDDASISGILTPATALGEPLIERLQRAGITFSSGV